jgi:GNAT superfamily N-acetyltransferase
MNELNGAQMAMLARRRAIALAHDPEHPARSSLASSLVPEVKYDSLVHYGRRFTRIAIILRTPDGKKVADAEAESVSHKSFKLVAVWTHEAWRKLGIAKYIHQLMYERVKALGFELRADTWVTEKGEALQDALRKSGNLNKRNQFRFSDR